MASQRRRAPISDAVKPGRPAIRGRGVKALGGIGPVKTILKAKPAVRPTIRGRGKRGGRNA